jgi:hypothetical protein
LIPSKKKAVEQPSSSSASGTEIPSYDSPDFGTWLEKEGNFERLLGSAEK